MQVGGERVQAGAREQQAEVWGHPQLGFEQVFEVDREQRVQAMSGERCLRVKAFDRQSQQSGDLLLKPREQERVLIFRAEPAQLFAAEMGARVDRFSGCWRERDHALRQGFELGRLPQFSGVLALDLAARGLGQAAGRDQHHSVDVGLMLAGDRLPDGCGQLCSRAVGAALDFLDQHQLLAVVDFAAQSRRTARAQGRVTLLAGQLEVLRIKIASAQDDQVLEPAGHHQLAVKQITEIAGAQEGADTGRGFRLEHFGGNRWLLPIALRHARTCDPDFADAVSRERLPGVRIDDLDLLLAPGPTTAHEFAHGHPGQGLCRAGHHAMLSQVLGCNGEDLGGLFHGAAAHEEGGFGQTVARIKSAAVEAARGKGGAEAVEGGRAHRLSAVVGHSPRAEVEPNPLSWRDLAHAELIREVGTAAGGRAEVRDGFQPARRTFEESEG